MDVNTKVESARIAGGAALVTIWGVTLNEWVAVATLLYLALQIFILCPKALKTIREIIEFIKRKF